MINEENFVYKLKEKSCIIQNKKNEYKITLTVFNNNTFDITIYTIKEIPTKKFVLNCTMEELIKNRFFKIFINVEEVFRELETKITKCNIIEETNVIFLDIPIGLNVIDAVILEIKQIEKSKDDIIEELKNEIINLKNDNKKLQTELYLRKNQQELKINKPTENLNENIDESKI